MGLEGKAVLITGGARGIGRGIAAHFLELGARVAVAGRTESDLQETTALLGSVGELTAHRCDVSDPQAVSSLVADVVAGFDGLDVLVCSHGVHEGEFSVLSYPLERWDNVMAINVRGTFLCGAAAARAMVEAERKGRIINISSTAALASVPHESAYDTSKGAVQSMTRAFALDLAPFGITVNAIAPGWIATPMLPEAIRDAYIGVVNPMRRFGAPADVAGAAAWLADPATSYVTGSTIIVDGGQFAALGFASQRDSASEPPPDR